MFWKVLENMRRREKLTQVYVKNVDVILLTKKIEVYDELK